MHEHSPDTHISAMKRSRFDEVQLGFAAATHKSRVRSVSPTLGIPAYVFGWTLAAGVQYAATLTGRLTAGLRGKK